MRTILVVITEIFRENTANQAMLRTKMRLKIQKVLEWHAGALCKNIRTHKLNDDVCVVIAEPEKAGTCRKSGFCAPLAHSVLRSSKASSCDMPAPRIIKNTFEQVSTERRRLESSKVPRLAQN